MEIFQTLGSQGTILVGFVSTAAEIVVAFLFLRSFKIIGRCEYARLKANAADHLRCHAEWERISLNNWLKKIRIASRDLGNNNRVEPEIDVRWRSSIVTDKSHNICSGIRRNGSGQAIKPSFARASGTTWTKPRND
jgi:hypothetical protein